VAFIPFPTRLVAHYLQSPDERAAVFAYGVTLLLMAVLFNVLWACAARNRRLIREDFPQSKVRAVTRAAAVGVPLTALILVIAIWSPVGAIIFALAISAFYLPGAARFDRS
jgi:putative copper export protein